MMMMMMMLEEPMSWRYLWNVIPFIYGIYPNCQANFPKLQCFEYPGRKDPASTLSWKHDSSGPCELEVTLDVNFFSCPWALVLDLAIWMFLTVDKPISQSYCFHINLFSTWAPDPDISSSLLWLLVPENIQKTYKNWTSFFQTHPFQTHCAPHSSW